MINESGRQAVSIVATRFAEVAILLNCEAVKFDGPIASIIQQTSKQLRDMDFHPAADFSYHNDKPYPPEILPLPYHVLFEQAVTESLIYIDACAISKKSVNPDRLKELVSKCLAALMHEAESVKFKTLAMHYSTVKEESERVH